MDVELVGRDDDLVRLDRDVSSGRHVLLTGEAGVGKSRLLAEVARRARGAGRPVTPIVGYAPSRHVPFGAVAHLLGSEAPPHRGLLLAQLLERLTISAPGAQPIVLVDDVDQLDDETCALVVSLATTGDAVVLASCRTSSLRDRRVVRLWSDQLLDQREIGPLDRAATDELVEALLGDTPSRMLSQRLWQITQGHPLFVRELVLAGRATGAITRAESYWTLGAALRFDGRLSDLVATRTDRLSAPAAEALATVAMTEPVDVRVLSELAESHALAELEEHDLLRVRAAEESPGGRPIAEVSHPLIGRVVRDRLGHFGRREVLERVVATDVARRDHRDALRLASWLLEVGRVPDAELATEAARQAMARFDHRTGARLAATVEPPTSESLMLAARAHAGLGEIERAIDELEQAVAVAADGEERHRATTMMIEVVGLVAGDIAGATKRLETAISATTEPDRRRDLEVRGLIVAGLGGRFADALSIADRAPLTAASTSVEAHALMALTLAQSMTGSLDGVDDRLDRAAELAAQVRLQEPYLAEQIGLNRVLALHAQARLERSVALVEERLGRTSDRAAIAPWLFVDTPAALLTGELDTAVRRTAESHELLLEDDPLGVRGVAAAMAAAVAGIRGATDLEEWVDRAEAARRPREVRISGWLTMARGWALAHAGAPELGAVTMHAGGAALIDGEHHVWGAIVLHGATRIGHAEVVMEELVGLREAGPLVALLVRHTRCAADGDGDGLRAVTRDLEAIGARGVAADACAQVARLTTTDDPVAHTRAALRAHELAVTCAGYEPWLLGAVQVPVTARQREIGRRAADGRTSREIADELDITAKTVDNHLQLLYAALDIHGRDELGIVYP